MVWIRIASVLFLLVSAACAGGETEAGRGSGGGLDGPDRALDWTLEPLYDLGGLAGEAWESFGRIQSLAFDGAGRLYVLDGQANQVTVVDPSGGFERLVGQPGNGPGELAGAQAMGVAPDGRVVVFDGRHRALVLFDELGGSADQVSVDVDAYGAPTGPLAFEPSGSLVFATRPRIRMGPDGPERGERGILRMVLDGSDQPPVFVPAWRASAPPAEAGSVSEAPGIRSRIPPIVAFEPDLYAASLAGGGVAVVDSFDYAVKILDPGSDVVHVIRRSIEPVPVDESLRETERARRRVLLEERGGPTLMVSTSDGQMSAVPEEQAKAFEESRIAGMAFHPFIPVVEALAADGEGRIWVQRSGPRPGVAGPTDLITAEGRYLGSLDPEELRIPAAFGPDGRVAILERDELDVPTIRVGRLHFLLPPSPPG